MALWTSLWAQLQHVPSKVTDHCDIRGGFMWGTDGHFSS